MYYGISQNTFRKGPGYYESALKYEEDFDIKEMISLEKQTIKLAIIDYNMVHVRVENKTHISVYHFEKVDETNIPCDVPIKPPLQNYENIPSSNKYSLKWDLPSIPTKFKLQVYEPPSTKNLQKASSISGTKPEDTKQKELVIDLWKQNFILSTILHRNKRRRESIKITS